MKQLIFRGLEHEIQNWQVHDFSAKHFAQETARLALEQRLIKLTEVTDSFTRKSVSYQLNKQECIHRWLKYKEGYSGELVEELLQELKIPRGGTVLDPFLGSGTTALVCKMLGINSIGFDILPMTKVAIKGKDSIFSYNTQELQCLYAEVLKLEVPKKFTGNFSYLPITEGAFQENTTKEILFFTKWNQNSSFSSLAKNLITLCILNSLEKVSFTSKDGQYLRWDYRSTKVKNANAIRASKGCPPIAVKLDKGEIPTLKKCLLEELKNVIDDIIFLQKNSKETTFPPIQFVEGSALYELPKLPHEILDGVITSPPYCNRYDYTRTYALEMNYLGVTNDQLKKLRQNLLSCTVENKTKIDFLKSYYSKLGRSHDFEQVIKLLNNNNALQEVLTALNLRKKAGEINNPGVLRMVEGYFTELAFIYAELFRVCKKGGGVAVVNDNVRYGGEVIPVDFISTEIAEHIGFEPVKIYTLKQLKGNSSQQMKKFGRIALRKSITIWRKPSY